MAKKNRPTATKEEYAARREKWYAAMESGDFSQVREMLEKVSKTKDDKVSGRCCLGVACVVAHSEIPMVRDIVLPRVSEGERAYYRKAAYNGDAEALPEDVRVWLGMETPSGTFNQKYRQDWPTKRLPDGQGTTTAFSLVDLNDDFKWSFKKIAAWVRAHPQVVYIEGTH